MSRGQNGGVEQSNMLAFEFDAIVTYEEMRVGHVLNENKVPHLCNKYHTG